MDFLLAELKNADFGAGGKAAFWRGWNAPGGARFVSPRAWEFGAPTWPNSRLGELLPHNWAKNQRPCRQHLTFTSGVKRGWRHAYDLFTYAIDETALARAQLMDGKLMLVTNVQDLSPAEVVRRYKSLADIERGFKVLKSEIEIAPVFHRLPERIKAHASLCFIALILCRVMRQRLKLAGSDLSPEAVLRRIQRHSVSINGAAPVQGVSPTHARSMYW